MMAMSAKRYQLLGYVVWNGAKWYLRSRLPSARIACWSVLACAGLTAGAVAIARRASS